MNEWINKIRTTVNLKIKGKNIERFIKRINSFNIDLLQINYLKYDEIIIKIYKKDLDRLNEIKTIYDIDILSSNGLEKYKTILKKNRLLLITIIVSITFIIYLSNTIFYIDVVHNNKEIREIIKEELSNNDIRVYSIKKDYDYIEEVKKKILEKYKDKIEWLEIENVGTKYIVKVEERKINKINNQELPRNLVALKDSIIIQVEANKGIILKNKNDYVKKGEIIVSGAIDLNGEIKNNVSAAGTVYGEVWYKVEIEYPLKYIEKQITSETKKVYTFKFLNKNISTYNDYFVTKEKVLYNNKVIPFSILKQTKNKIKKIEQTLNINKKKKKATKVGIDKIESKLNDNEYIIDVKKLKVEKNNSKIILELFISVCEDITDYRLIEGE